MKTLLVSLAVLVTVSGCATMHYEFVDGTDGSCMSMTDIVPYGMKRDVAATSANYVWDRDGGGTWQTGGNADATDGTQAIAVLEKLINMIYGVASLRTQAPEVAQD